MKNNYLYEYIDSKYKVLTTLSQTEYSTAEVVKCMNGTLAIKKTVRAANTVYKTIKELSHRGLTKIIEVIELENETIVIEEYLNGESLQNKINDHFLFNEDVIIDWFKQLCYVISYLHSYNIIHRDIKPSNIIISSDGIVKLIDYDISRVYDQHNQYDTTYLGTKEYASPEQYGFKQTDQRSDIYSLGVLLNQLLTGKHLNEERRDKGKLGEIISKCTMFDPDQRFQTVDTIIKELLKRTKTKTPRLKFLFYKGELWKTILLVIISFLLVLADVDKYHGFLLVVMSIKSLLMFLPVIAFGINFLHIRREPLISAFRSGRKIVYGLAFFMLWLLSLLIYAGIIIILFDI